MKQKIEWYKEVLELEPGSRVFFPLAKLLAADGEADEAVRTLHQGLLRHPDHVEARLLLVELLFLQNAGDALKAEIDALGTLLATYPGFWRAWSDQLASTLALHDASLAMRFFAAAIQGKKVSWSEIIERGLRSMLDDDDAAPPSPVFPAHKPSAQEEAAMRRSAQPVSGMSTVQKNDMRQNAREAVLQEQFEKPLCPAAPLHDAPGVLPSQETALLMGSEESDDMTEEESEETFSIRTRSMAEILAEQGDVTGALDIYQELMQTAGPDEKHSLMARADELAHRLNVGPLVDAGQTEEKNKASGGENTKIVNLLESLAQRLEARAR
jgi:tetratricopeptide (TPR) repeat protein